MTVKFKLTMLHALRKTGNVDYSLNHIFKKLSLLYCFKDKRAQRALERSPESEDF